MTIPAVVGMRDVTSRVRTGDMVIIDGKEGLVIVAPDAATLAKYKAEQRSRIDEERRLETLKDLPAPDHRRASRHARREHRSLRRRESRDEPRRRRHRAFPH